MTDTGTELELDTWTVPGDSRDRSWGEGIVVARSGGPTVFFRFYEFNLAGAVREGAKTWADKEQPSTVTCTGERATVAYPDHGVRLDAEIAEGGVTLSLSTTALDGRDWPPLAALDPCLSPGRDSRDAPLVPAFADEERRHTYYYGRSGLERAGDQVFHVHEDHYDAVREARAADLLPEGEGLLWDWCDRSGRLAEPLVVRESPDGAWATGIAWEETLGAHGHDPWNCMHLTAKVGPLAAGEAGQLRGRIYLEPGPGERIVDRYAADFGR